MINCFVYERSENIGKMLISTSRSLWWRIQMTCLGQKQIIILRYSFCNDIKRWKAAKCHILAAGTREYLTLLLDKWLLCTNDIWLHIHLSRTEDLCWICDLFLSKKVDLFSVAICGHNFKTILIINLSFKSFIEHLLVFNYENFPVLENICFG